VQSDFYISLVGNVCQDIRCSNKDKICFNCPSGRL